MKIQLFGQLKDLVQQEYIQLPPVDDTTALTEALLIHFPTLQTARFAVAVDKKIVQERTPLNEHSEIALLPPFSGG